MLSTMLRTFLLVGAGGAVGSMLRYGISLLLPRASAYSFPTSTLLVNMAGCLAIGLLAGFAGRSSWMTGTGWPLLATGVCGGFTTFSAFSLEALKLMERGATGTAIAYAVVSVVGGIILCYAGFYLSNHYLT